MLTPESMAADAHTALALDRAQGVPIPSGEEYDSAFVIGFCAGAAWALAKIKTENARPDPLSQALNEGDGTYRP